MTTLRPFHVAVPVADLEVARAFYVGILGCSEGRSDKQWVDFDFFGHQFVCHLCPPQAGEAHRNEVDDKHVPVPHYGIVLAMDDWQRLATRLTEINQTFIIEPYIRFAGLPGEQGTFFIRDPSGNALEFKGFTDLETLFAR
ncbi:MAG: VOC family protein [Gammaproteobacteria bacterium]|jgi:hypothetical protein|nr:glyoxalase [Chromatiales bacterium]MDP6673590.1 VOC family protein [Gammaproteobacteria bacterium]